MRRSMVATIPGFMLLIGLALGMLIPQTSVAQTEPPVWFSQVLWYPSLEEAGIGLAELVNQIDAACEVDVDPVASTNGGGATAVYGFAVAWTCLPGGAPFGAGTWNSTTLWRPTIADTGLAMTEILNEIDGSCRRRCRFGLGVRRRRSGGDLSRSDTHLGMPSRCTNGHRRMAGQYRLATRFCFSRSGTVRTAQPDRWAVSRGCARSSPQMARHCRRSYRRLRRQLVLSGLAASTRTGQRSRRPVSAPFCLQTVNEPV
ncbi:MAG: hypothetical protein R2839_12030 [Thermomicrobiales bacterium]